MTRPNQNWNLSFSNWSFSAAYLREHCRRNELYMIPKYNDVLYLHYKVVLLHKFTLQSLSTIILKKFWTTSVAGTLWDWEPRGVHGPEVPLAWEQLHQDHQGARPPQPPQMPLPPSQQNRADNGDQYELWTSPELPYAGSVQVERAGQPELIQQLHQPSDKPCSPP